MLQIPAKYAANLTIGAVIKLLEELPEAAEYCKLERFSKKDLHRFVSRQCWFRNHADMSRMEIIDSLLQAGKRSTPGIDMTKYTSEATTEESRVATNCTGNIFDRINRYANESGFVGLLQMPNVKLDKGSDVHYGLVDDKWVMKDITQQSKLTNDGLVSHVVTGALNFNDIYQDTISKFTLEQWKTLINYDADILYTYVDYCYLYGASKELLDKVDWNRVDIKILDIYISQLILKYSDIENKLSLDTVVSLVTNRTINISTVSRIHLANLNIKQWEALVDFKFDILALFVKYGSHLSKQWLSKYPDLNMPRYGQNTEIPTEPYEWNVNMFTSANLLKTLLIATNITLLEFNRLVEVDRIALVIARPITSMYVNWENLSVHGWRALIDSNLMYKEMLFKSSFEVRSTL